MKNIFLVPHINYLQLYNNLNILLYPQNKNSVDKYLRKFVLMTFPNRFLGSLYSFKVPHCEWKVDDTFFVSHKFHSNIHNHHRWNLAYTPWNIYWKILLITQNRINLFDQNRSTNILWVDPSFEKTNKKINQYV